jgi:hypothetical protein
MYVDPFLYIRYFAFIIYFNFVYVLLLEPHLDFLHPLPLSSHTFIANERVWVWFWIYDLRLLLYIEQGPKLAT